MKKYMKLAIFAAAFLACGGIQAWATATAVGAGGGKKAVNRSLDASGNPVMFNDDKPWKVFEFAYQTAPAQLVDESAVAPKQGLVKRVCLESSVAAIATTSEIIVLWDTSTVAAMTMAGTGRRIAPPFPRASGTVACTEINAMFTSGLGVMSNVATGSAYIYWRELGGAR